MSKFLENIACNVYFLWPDQGAYVPTVGAISADVPVVGAESDNVPVIGPLSDDEPTKGADDEGSA